MKDKIILLTEKREWKVVDNTTKYIIVSARIDHALGYVGNDIELGKTGAEVKKHFFDCIHIRTIFETKELAEEYLFELNQENSYSKYAILEYCGCTFQ